jgi:hypothetical protein
VAKAAISTVIGRIVTPSIIKRTVDSTDPYACTLPLEISQESSQTLIADTAKPP